MVLAHPDDQLLLGVQWDSRVYMEKMLPFYLSSKPIIFSAGADALWWILIQKRIPKLLHYFYSSSQVTITGIGAKAVTSVNLQCFRSSP